MNFPEFVKILREHGRSVIVFALLVALVSYGVAQAQSLTFESSLALSIIRIHRQQTTQYQFDGYYALQAADLFGETVMSWFVTPAVLKEIYDHAQIAPDTTSLERFQGRFRVKKASSQNLMVRYSAGSPEEAKQIAASIREVVSAKAQAVNKTPEGDPVFQVDVSDPVILPIKFSPALAGGIGLLVGGILAFGFFVLRRSVNMVA